MFFEFFPLRTCDNSSRDSFFLPVRQSLFYFVLCFEMLENSVLPMG